MRKLDKIRNDETRKIIGCMSTIAQLVYDRQHKWLGHVLCMDNERIAKKLLQGKEEGSRKLGKTR